jgi:hypothetical protein
MATEPQILANRRNAQKSTGPRTPEAKAAVAKNALKHGLTARQDVIKGENQADFDLYRDEMLDELAPVGPMETMLANRVVSLSWRLERAARIQNQTIDALIAKNIPRPVSQLTQSILDRAYGCPQPNPADLDPNLALGRMVIKDFSNARVLDRLLLYERRIEHSLYRTMAELQRLTLTRKSHLADDPDEQACHASLLAHKIPPFMQNKANFPTPANEPNPSPNKHLRTQTAPSTIKKQSQSPKTPKSAQTPPAQRLTKKPPAGAEKRTNPKPNQSQTQFETHRSYG